MDVYIKEGRVYGLLKNRKILKLTLDNQIQFCLFKKMLYLFIKKNIMGMIRKSMTAPATEKRTGRL